MGEFEEIAMLVVNYGTNLYGRVLNVPGVLHVATVFWHVAFIPLAPRTSWIVLDEPGMAKLFRARTQWSGIPLVAPVWRSVFAAWFRAALIVFALVQLGREGYHGATRWEPVSWPWVIGAAAVLAVASVAGRLGRASFEDIVALLRAADAPEELVVRVERAFGRMIAQRWAGRDETTSGAPVGIPAEASGLYEREASEEASGEDVASTETFVQRNAPRLLGAAGLAGGILLLLEERNAVLARGVYYPKLVYLGCAAVALGAPALVLGIGRNADLRVPWKAAVVFAAAVLGFAAGYTAPRWLFQF